MFYNPAIILHSSFLVSPFLMSLAKPLPQYSLVAPACHASTTYSIEKSEPHDKPAVRAGGLCCSGVECKLGAGVAHTVGVTIEVGADAGLDL